MTFIELLKKNFVSRGMTPTGTRQHVFYLFSILLLSAPVLAVDNTPNPSLSTILSGQFVPLRIRLRDLSAHWSRIGIPGNGITYCYTKGQIVTIGGDSYLITYKTDVSPLTADTLLAMFLVNLHNCPGFTDIQPFNLKRELVSATSPTSPQELQKQRALKGALLENGPELEIFQAARIQAANINSLSRLKQLATAMQIYLQDNDEKFPDMSESTKVRESLRPYLKEDRLFTHPITAVPYRWNPALSGKNFTQIDSAPSVILVYEAGIAPDGTRGVAFADGHTVRMKEDEWQKLSKKAELL